jgi:hypothetical protein
MQFSKQERVSTYTKETGCSPYQLLHAAKEINNPFAGNKTTLFQLFERTVDELDKVSRATTRVVKKIAMKRFAS